MSHPIAVGATCLLFASATAITAIARSNHVNTSISCEVLRGENIDEAILVALVGGLAALLVFGAAALSKQAWLIASGLWVGVATLCFALVLVVRDGAMYEVRGNDLRLFHCDAASASFAYLLVLWGLALCVLVVQIAYLLTRGKEPSQPGAER